MFCRLVNNAATDVVPTFKDRFHKDLHKEFVVCPEEVKAGWLYDPETETWSEPVIIEENQEPQEPPT